MATSQMTVTEVIQALGGTAAMKAMFGVKAPAVSHWRKTNRFPPKLHLRILRECFARGIAYDPAPDQAPTSRAA